MTGARALSQRCGFKLTVDCVTVPLAMAPAFIAGQCVAGLVG